MRRRKFKVLGTLMIAITLFASTSQVVFASSTDGEETSETVQVVTSNEEDVLVKQLRKEVNTVEKVSTQANTSAVTISSSSSGDSSEIAWEYNTGTTLPQKANYSKYNLLNTVKKGDIIYEAKGFYGITGHVAIVEGIYYSSKYNQYYIRIIEAISDGVVRSVFDDDRLDSRDASIYRVSSTTSSKISSALSFAVSQLGDSYFLDFQKDYNNQPDWYCSELVWASYKRQGIELETLSIEPGVTPREVTIYSSVTIRVY